MTSIKNCSSWNFLLIFIFFTTPTPRAWHGLGRTVHGYHSTTTLCAMLCYDVLWSAWPPWSPPPPASPPQAGRPPGTVWGGSWLSFHKNTNHCKPLAPTFKTLFLQFFLPKALYEKLTQSMFQVYLTKSVYRFYKGNSSKFIEMSKLYIDLAKSVYRFDDGNSRKFTEMSKLYIDLIKSVYRFDQIYI